MRLRSVLATSHAASLAAAFGAAPAGAAVPHVVQPGETLWSIAAANNLTTRTVAAFNGLSESSQVVLGSTIMVPTTVEGYASLQRAGLVPATPTASAAVAAPATTTSSSGAYTVRRLAPDAGREQRARPCRPADRRHDAASARRQRARRLVLVLVLVDVVGRPGAAGCLQGPRGRHAGRPRPADRRLGRVDGRDE